MMEKFISFLVLLAILTMAALVIGAQAWTAARDEQTRSTESQLQTIAEILLTSKGEEVLTECGVGPTVDAWDTQIRTVYMSTPDITVVIALSAGPDGLWETDDDDVAAAYKPGIFD